MEVGNNAVCAGGAEEFSRGIQQVIWVCSISFSSAMRTVGAQPYLFVDFPFMWSCNVLDGMPYCLAAA